MSDSLFAARFKKVVNVNLSPSILGGFVGLGCGIVLYFILLIMYGDIWFASSWDKLLYFIYIVGQYSGWIFLFCLIIALINTVISLVFPKFQGPRRPRLFYSLFAVFIQALFWGEVINKFYYFTEFNLMKHKLGHIAVIATISSLFYLTYKILKSITISEKSADAKHPPMLVGSTVIIHFFIGSFLIPVTPAMKTMAFNLESNKIPNYDGNGQLIDGEDKTLSKLYNILLISIDTLRGDYLGCYGNPDPVSPFIDSLSQHGVLFRNAYALSPFTVPSHGTMFTSLYPSEHGGFRPTITAFHSYYYDRIKSPTTSLTEILRNFGYVTVAFTGGGYMSSYYGHSQGFYVYDDSNDRCESFDKAIEFLQNYQETSPFFLFLHTFHVHDYFPSISYEAMFCDTSLKIDKETLFTEIRIRDNNNIGFFRRHPERAVYAKNLYNATIREVDERVKKVIEAIRKRDILDNTLVIITSDHGEEFWEHNGSSHGKKLYEEELRVPLMLLLPHELDVSKRIVKNRVCLLDISPTILDLLQIPPLNKAHGISLLPLIKYGKSEERKFYFEANKWGNMLGVLDEDYKYIFNKLPPIEKRIFTSKWLYFPLGGLLRYSKNELYNLEKDPAEQNNIIEEEPGLAQRMKNDLVEQFLRRFPEYYRVYPEFEDTIKPLDEKTIEKLRALGYVH